jgi:hypothetical protein
VKNEKFTIRIDEIMTLKKVLLSLRNLEENRLKASIIKERLIDIKKYGIIEIMMKKRVRKTPIREIK